jgi:phosphatidylglycerol:prolipoprotein diacylglycerol transferase
MRVGGKPASGFQLAAKVFQLVLAQAPLDESAGVDPGRRVSLEIDLVATFGVILAILGTLVYCRLKRLSVLDMFDYFAPTLGIGLVLTRIGCFLNGCCFGTPTDLPWGVTFPVGSIPHAIFGNAHLHPAQIYSSLYGLGLAVLLHYMLKQRKFVGQVVAVLFTMEAIFRFAIEYVRFYESAMHFSLAGLQPTYNQVASLALFALGLAIYFYQQKNPAAQLR